MSWDEAVLQRFAEHKEDVWAPDFAKAIEGLSSESSEHTSAEGLSFVESTVITGNFADILGRVYKTVAGGGSFKKFLDVDMGFGKTHLLIYTLYTLYSPKALFDVATPPVKRELSRLGFENVLHKRSAIFAFDFKTPTRNHLKHALNLFAHTLSNAGQKNAADLVRRSADVGDVPDAAEVLKYVGREVPLVVLLDELFYPATRSKTGDEESKVASDVVTFVKDVVEQESGRRPLVVLAASARRDIYYAKMLSAHTQSSVYYYIMSFVDRLSRYEAAVGAEVRWLSVDEALEILERRLKLKGKLHESMRRFAERFLGPDPELGSQHLRSLIRAVAMMALDEARTRRRFVSVANFGANVMDFLFGGSQSFISSRYKDAFAKSLNAAKSDAGKDAVRAVFALTVVSNEEKLTKVIMADLAKLKSEIPRVSAKDIQRLLEDLGYGRDDVLRAFDELESAPYVVSVDERGERFYHVSFVESPTAFLRSVKESHAAQYLAKPESLFEKAVMLFRDAAGLIGDSWLSLYVFEDPDEVIKGLRPDSFHILLYNGREPKRLVEETARQNFAVVVADFNSEPALLGFAEFFATLDAVRDVTNWYITRQNGAKSDDDVYARITRRWLEAVKDELSTEAQRFVHFSLQRFVEGLRNFVKHAYVYACKMGEGGYECKAESISLEYGRIEKRFEAHKLSSYADSLYKTGVDIVYELLKQMSRQVAQAASVAYEPNPGLIAEIVQEHLRKADEFHISTSDKLEVFWKGKKYYLLPSATRAAEDAAKQLASLVDVVREGSTVIFRRKAVRREAVAPERPQALSASGRCLEDVIAEVEKKLGETGWAKIDVSAKCGGISVKAADVIREVTGFKAFEYGGKVLVVKPGASVPLRELLPFLQSADGVALTIRLEVSRERALQVLSVLSPLQNYVNEVKVE